MSGIEEPPGFGNHRFTGKELRARHQAALAGAERVGRRRGGPQRHGGRGHERGGRCSGAGARRPGPGERGGRPRAGDARVRRPGRQRGDVRGHGVIVHLLRVPEPRRRLFVPEARHRQPQQLVSEPSASHSGGLLHARGIEQRSYFQCSCRGKINPSCQEPPTSDL